MENKDLNFGEQGKSEKDIIWEEKQREVDKIVDGLGEEIDKNIKDVVVAFVANGFSTSASCEGHIVSESEKQRGELYPWIDICLPEPEGWQESEDKKEQWRAENLLQRQRLKNLLKEFYKDKQVTDDANLIFEDIGIFGRFRIRSLGGENMQSLNSERQKQLQKIYRKEMNDFAKFLKQKFMLDSN
ncbi:MAG: hypothetical protein A2312_04535 [Candidatus Staskawiczbacteria bacterium RIFOXYB2_FULL_32_9]|uniref:Uncharacterized protein n=1 Tax=Candidatus Staskawiczbacteria bacterium RIFOXYD1_FULL_32_13 TaxID=1802234 RepID=A0A1G2JMW3_9BACT|nr:MAG: hypothetical protein UR22_C0003G0007 [Parcubacteria group bacterium GW2011_GWC2_32_10]OGZ78951.1 MAG: hypothetical protein A2256_02730 [Candidatus Staskawiczbacteria bacterium RIFOXYA2_FULL_32_7]OGZ80422.1 MAG: hypothetical protein A2360_00960 [Candidatus Staskawiczbacteria bacterium RIFOXYB1_FULL_32_11]OGZ82649.1 MAG: hypothetical protein A2312_04535 [Candidatus Staskawiczbacteria bacterium RIFOXYB2_FULL_32_9]OGZ87640.1 MAG: hypothetical protein A2463_01370 [Candidatus Staskawiczbacter